MKIEMKNMIMADMKMRTDSAILSLNTRVFTPLKMPNATDPESVIWLTKTEITPLV